MQAWQHLKVIDRKGFPIQLSLTGGKSHHELAADDLLDNIGAGAIVLSGKAHDADRIRTSIRERGSFANIPPKAIRRMKPYFGMWLCRWRNLIEWCLSE